MWFVDDADIPSEALELVFAGCEGAAFARLAEWLKTVGDRVRLGRGAEAQRDLQENLVRMQRDLRDLADARAVPLQWLPMDPGESPLRLLAATVEALNYLSARPEFSRANA